MGTRSVATILKSVSRSHELVAAGGAGVDPVLVGHHDHAVHIGQIPNRAYHGTGVHVDLDDLPGTLCAQ